MPAGARISAGKSGRVDRSLPSSAEVLVNWVPVSCMPSPESPAKRMTTSSIFSAAAVGLSFSAIMVISQGWKQKGPGLHARSSGAWPPDILSGRRESALRASWDFHSGVRSYQRWGGSEAPHGVGRSHLPGREEEPKRASRERLPPQQAPI